MGGDGSQNAFQQSQTHSECPGEIQGQSPNPLGCVYPSHCKVRTSSSKKLIKPQTTSLLLFKSTVSFTRKTSQKQIRSK